MTFPRPQLPLTWQVLVVLASGLTATVSYYSIVSRLKEVGIRTPMFRNVAGVLNAFQTYRRIAVERGWPTWPVSVYWLSVAVGFLAAMTVLLQRSK